MEKISCQYPLGVRKMLLRLFILKSWKKLNDLNDWVENITVKRANQSASIAS